MQNIFVIDKITKENLGIIDFIPRREERIILKSKRQNNLECKVCCIMYHPIEHAVLVFVDVVEPYYSKMISEIKWK